MKLHNNKIAVLMTCYNRVNTTVMCLTSLFETSIPNGFEIDVFLVDDGSIDGTKVEVKRLFPQVFVIEGDGNLFWNQGMRLAWETASNLEEYDFYMWLNDDTLLKSNAIYELLECYQKSLIEKKVPGIIVGECESFLDNNIFSYGGRTELGPVVPNGRIQECRYINGNCVLISKRIFMKLGLLSKDFRHNFGDVDYGLRAIDSGFRCVVTRCFIAICSDIKEMPDWCNPRIPLRKRLMLWYAPKGPNLNEYKIYRKRFWRKSWRFFYLKTYLGSCLKIIFPSIFSGK